MKRDVLRRDDVIELRRREILLAPRLPATDRDRAAAVVAVHEMCRVVGIDPEVVMVTVRASAHARERGPTRLLNLERPPRWAAFVI